ncbi:MAG: 2-aminoethylphosphonate--pyruvate transaminase [Rhizobiales bacterium]|nr:2-aminoethylphosphonate--pyruvate transaminase [Hyphomicrobiales bacterium]
MIKTYFVAPRYKGPPGQEDMPWLLSLAPVTTSRAVKIAMLVDYSPEDVEFRALLSELRRDLKRLAGAGAAHECVLLPGTAGFAVEAVLSCLAPAKRKKTLVICNGRDGERAAAILSQQDRPVIRLTKPDNVVVTVDDVTAALDADGEISHIWVAHCDSAAGLVNTIGDIGKLAKDRQKTFMVDATNSFGALPLDVVGDLIDVLVASPDSCLEGVPGFSILMVKRDLLIASEGKSHSAAFDLHAHWQDQEGMGVLRAAPPPHAVAALRQALRELETEGGIGMRRARYQRNTEELITRMKAMGFTPYLPETEASPIVQAFLAPRDKRFDFGAFREGLRQRGFLIAAGALTGQKSFRISSIGGIDHKVIKSLAGSVEEVLKELDIQEFTPQEASA